MIELAKPPGFHGAAFAAACADLGLSVTTEDVYVSGDRVIVSSIGEEDRQRAEEALASHSPPPPPPDPEDEFDADLAAAAAKPTLEEQVDALFAALRGSNGGPGAEPRRGQPA